MFELSSDDLCGVWAPLLVPMNARGRLDTGALEVEIEHLAGTGVSGLLLDATSAPWGRLPELDAREVLDAAAGQAYAVGLAVVADDELLDLRAASELGASAALVHVRPGDVAECVRLALAAEPSGIVLDGRAVGAWTPPALREALDATPILAYVHGGADAESLEGIRDLERQIGVLVSPEIGHAAWRWGAAGTCGALVALSPGGFVDLGSRMEDDGRELAQLELRLQRFVELALAPLRRHGQTPGDLTRHLAAAGGWCPPLGPVDREVVAELAAHASALLPELVR